MKQWLTSQAADPEKLKALEGHFTFKDLNSGPFKSGVREMLKGMAVWPKHAHHRTWPPATTLSLQRFNATGRSNTGPDIDATADVFQQIGQRQYDRSFNDAKSQITTDADVTKANILSGLSKAAMIAMLFAPVAIAVPEVALALDGLYIASGITEAGIGADDLAKANPAASVI